MRHSKSLKVVLAICIVSSTFLLGCIKAKVPTPTIVEPTKWEKISGNYKVYDTLGNYLYDMSISHLDTLLSSGFHLDSLLFNNFDAKFHFSSIQGFGTNYPETYIGISPPNPIKDNYGKSWHLYGLSDSEFYYNTFRNDTIKLRYRMNNILYYVQDVVPYVDDTIWQVAVKEN